MKSKILIVVTLLFLSSCASSTKTTKSNVVGEIPTLGKKFNHSGHQYQFVENQVSWDVAKKLAEEAGGYLAVFETIEEMNNVLVAREKRSTYWVGLSDSEREGNWTWINGTALNNNMVGYLERGESLKSRDYGHILLQGGLMSRHIGGGLPEGWKGQMYVSGYLIEWETPN